MFYGSILHALRGKATSIHSWSRRADFRLLKDTVYNYINYSRERLPFYFLKTSRKGFLPRPLITLLSLSPLPLLLLCTSYAHMDKYNPLRTDEDHFAPGYEVLESEMKDMRERGKKRKISDYYRIGKKLGEGSYSKVYEAVDVQTSQAVAVKMVSKKYTPKETFWKEVSILKALGKHPNLIQLYDAFETETDFYLVTDLVEGGELFEALVHHGAYSEKQASDLLRQVICALGHMHQRGIAHADIKPENLLLVDSSNSQAGVKLIDFGFSASGCDRKLQQSMGNDGSGTYAYWAPEQFKAGEFGVCSDIWSFGVLMYIVLYGFHPFDPEGTASDAELKRNILAGQWELNKNIQISEEAANLLKRCLNPDPTKRVTTEELVVHPWITGELTLSDKPLDDSHKRLIHYHRMRRRLKGNILAMLFENRSRLQNQPKILSDKAKDDLTDINETALSTTLNAFDPERKGYISSADVTRALTVPVSEANDMVAAVESSPAAGLSYKDVAALLASIQKVTVTRGNTVFKEGDFDDGFYIIIKGDVEVTCRSKETGRTVIGRMGSGDFFGETETVFASSNITDISELRRKSLKKAGLIPDSSDDTTTSIGTEARHSTITCTASKCELMRFTKADLDSLTAESSKASVALQKAALERSHSVFLSLLADATYGVKVTTLKPGDLLFNEGDSAESVYFIKEGVFEVTKVAGADNKPVFVKDLQKGSYVGEMGLILNKTRNATVTCKKTARKGCKVTEISKQSFQKVMSNRSVAESVRDIVRQKEVENEQILKKGS